MGFAMVQLCLHINLHAVTYNAVIITKGGRMTDREAAFGICFFQMPKHLERLKKGLSAQGWGPRVIERVEQDYNDFMDELKRLHESGQGLPDDVFARLSARNYWVKYMQMALESIILKQEKHKSG